MGKTEKIVVLGVLFLIVLILVVSLDPGSDAVLAGPQGQEVAGGQAGILDPGTGGPETLDPGILDPRVSGPETALPGPAAMSLSGVPLSGVPLSGVPLSGEAIGEQGGGEVLGPAPGEGPARPTVDPPPATRPGLLSAEVRPIYEVQETPPDDWALRSLAGLSDHRFDPSLKVYVVTAGDTFENLAERYYEHSALAALLARNNEGLQELEAGMQILMPIHDDGIGDEQLYEVQQDDSLWKIAKKVYGQGHLWTQIWEANRGVLSNADAVKPGMKLVIPGSGPNLPR